MIKRRDLLTKSAGAGVAVAAANLFPSVAPTAKGGTFISQEKNEKGDEYSIKLTKEELSFNVKQELYQRKNGDWMATGRVNAVFWLGKKKFKEFFNIREVRVFDKLIQFITEDLEVWAKGNLNEQDVRNIHQVCNMFQPPELAFPPHIFRSGEVKTEGKVMEAGTFMSAKSQEDADAIASAALKALQ